MRALSIVLVTLASASLAGQSSHTAPEVVGTWRGTSTCTDRVAAPACNDEVVVYDITPGPKGTAHWKADKVVGGVRQDMGEFDMAFNDAEGCWYVEFQTPRVHAAWCLRVTGDRMTGELRDLPSKKQIRAIEARRQ